MKLLFAVLLAGTVVAWGQDAPTPGRRNNLWEAQMPAGKYVVRIPAITSVSLHEYLVDGTARVTEVNISTTGSELARFYYIEPAVPQAPDGIGQSLIDKAEERTRELAARAGTDQPWQKVVKNYPITTHARTIEYRLVTKEQLTKLFESVERSFTTGQPGVFKP